MKVLHIVPTYYPAVRYGGPIKSEHELNKWLVKKGVDVTVYTTNLDGNGVLDVPLEKEVNIDGVKVYYFPVTFKPWQYSWKLHRALAKTGKNFDLIRITSVFLAASTLGAYYAKKLKIPYYISPRGSLMRETLNKKSFKKTLYLDLIEKRNLKDATIHFTTEMEKKEYLDLNLPFKNYIIVPNGVEESINNVPQGFFKDEFKISSDKKIVLSLGRLSWKKGFDILIPAFAEVVKKEPKAVLVIAGGNEEGYKKEIEKLISNYKLREGENVIFAGMINGDLKDAAYQDSDVFVLPSYAENFGNTVIEAAAHGTTSIITKNVAIGSEIENAGAGIVIGKISINDDNSKKDAIMELAEKIHELFENPEKRRKMGEAGKKLVKTEFLWPEIADKFINEFDKLSLK